MGNTTTTIRVTVVPRDADDKYLYFCALVTPIVVSADTPALKVAEVFQLQDWPGFIGLPWPPKKDPLPPKSGELAPRTLATRFGIKLIQPLTGATVSVKGLDIDNDTWWKKNEIQEGLFNQEMASKLWKVVMDKAWIATEQQPTASATLPQQNQHIIQPSDQTPDATSPPTQVRAAERAHRSTLEGITSATLNPVASRYFLSRALDLPFPGDDGAGNLEEYRFLLARMQRQGETGNSNRVQSQNGTAANAPQGADPNREFHQLISAYGAHPLLLRALGLLFDFRIDRPAADPKTKFDPGQPFLVSLTFQNLAGDDQPLGSNQCAIVAAANDTSDHAGETLCQLLKEGIFTPVPAAATILDPAAQFFVKGHFDTMQWDLLALLRAALREKDFVPAPPSPLGEPVAQRPALVDLPGRSITLFRTGSALLDETQAALQQKHPLAANASLGEGQPNITYGTAWTADALIRGYLAEVCCCTGYEGERRLWSEWKSLTRRQIDYLLPSTPVVRGTDGRLVATPEDEKKKSRLFIGTDDAPISLAITEGLQPLSGWLLRSISVSGNGNNEITLTDAELGALGIPTGPDFVNIVNGKHPGLNLKINAQGLQKATEVKAHTYLLQTHTGPVVVADVGVAADLAGWREKKAVNFQLAEARPTSPLQAAMSRLTPPGAPFVFGEYVDLEGLVPPPGKDQSVENIFLVTQCRFPAVDEGYGLAGTVIGAPSPRSPKNLAAGAAGAVESVVRIERAQEPIGQAILDDANRMTNRSTFIHLRRLVTGPIPPNGQSPIPYPIPPDGFANFAKRLPKDLHLDGDTAKDLLPGALFIDGQGEFALSVASSAQVHVAGFLKPALTPGGSESGILRLQFVGPSTAGRFRFALYEPETTTVSDAFLPVNLELSPNVHIQTLTNTSAKPADITPQAIFRARLERVGSGDISVTELVEIAPSSSIRVVSLDNFGQIQVQTTEGRDPLAVEVHPFLTIVECAEPTPAAATPATPPNSSGDGGFSGGEITPGESSPVDIGGGSRYIRGPWAEQGMRLQEGDQCLMEFGRSATSNSGLLATRIVIGRHDPSLTLVGFFLPDSSASLSPTDLTTETVFAFQELTPAAPQNAQASTSRPVKLIVNDDVNVISGPGMPNQPWRYRQGPPPPGVLVKVFLASGVSKTDGGPLAIRSLEVLDGLEAVLGFTNDKPSKLTLALPGFNDLFTIAMCQGVADAISGSKLPLATQRGNVHFLQDNIAGQLDITVQGFVTTGGQGLWTVTLSSIPGSLQITVPPDSLDGVVRDANALVEMILTFSVDASGQAAPTRVLLTRNVHPRVRLQLASFERDTQRIEVQIVFRESNGTLLAPGTRTALYLENVGDNDAFNYLSSHIPALIDSGLPIDLEAEETMVVLVDPSDATPASGQIDQWSLFAWPATDDTLNDKTLEPTRIRSDALATLWPIRAATFLFNPPVDTDLTPPLYRLVAPLDEKKQRKPIYGTQKSFAQRDAISQFPPNIHFLPDQMIVDDAVFHWFGRSLAVGAPGDAGLTPGKPGTDVAPPAPSNDPVRLDVTLRDRGCVPLRYGWIYAFRLRPVFLTGNSPQVKDTDDQESIIFRPFGDAILRLPDYEDLDTVILPDSTIDIKKLTPFDVPFLRLEPLAPPRIGWPDEARNPKDPDFLKRNGWGELSDVCLLTSGPTGMTCNIYRDAAEMAVLQPDANIQGRQLPKIIVHAPEAPFRVAELSGFLDYLFHALEKQNGGFDVDAVRQLYAELQKLDQPAPAPLPAGFVPKRLPDPHSNQYSLAVRPFGEATPKLIDFHPPKEAPWPVPSFGTDPATWWNSEKTTTPLVLQVLADPPPDTARQQAVGVVIVALQDGTMGIYLPPNADCELTLRSIPTPDSLRSLALARLLEQLAAQLRKYPLPTDGIVLPQDISPEELLKKVETAWTEMVAGNHPVLSPGVTMRLRHMTARPARPPVKDSLLMAGRLPGTTKATFDGRYRLDRPSTGGLLIEAATEIPYEDKPGTALPRVPFSELQRILPPEFLPAPPVDVNIRTFFGFSSDDRHTISSVDFTISRLVPINLDPSRSSTAGPSAPPPISQAGGQVEAIRYEHDPGDTRHRTVFYRPLAVSRFEQFFPESERAYNPCPGPYDAPLPNREPADPDAAVRWDRVEIPATARPHPPVLHDQNVVFEFEPSWNAEEAAWERTGRDWVFKRTRRAGLRLWLERPWYSSGSGEALAVVCWNNTRMLQGEGERYLRTVSRWGSDPMFEQTVGPETDMGVLVRDDFTCADDNSPADLTVPPSTAAPPNATPIGGDPALALAVHQPKFHPEERLWYCDIFIRPRRYTPHVSLSIVRYQPFALPSCAVSEAVRVDWSQIQPPRTLRIETHLQGTLRLEVLLTGIFPPSLKNDRRLVVCRVQRFPKSLRPDHTSSSNLPDLGWRDVELPAGDLPVADIEAPATPQSETQTASLENERASRFAADDARRFLRGLVLMPEQTRAGVHYKIDFEIERGPRGLVPEDEPVVTPNKPAPSAPKASPHQVPSDEHWTPADAFRVSVEEYELYPAAYVMTEGRKWLPRLIYSDQAHLPESLVRKFVKGLG